MDWNVTRGSTRPDRNLGLDLVRATEAAALASARYMGRGNRDAANEAAIDAMHHLLGTLEMDGIVIAGEGEKNDAPKLYNGEVVGTGDPPAVDIAVDPIDGTRLMAKGINGALSIVALAERGTIFDPGPCTYMEKIVVGGEAAEAIDLEASVADNLKSIASAMKVRPADLTVAILDRDRHRTLTQEVRDAGARVKGIAAADAAAAVAVVSEGTGVDVLLGIGPAPEGVISACAVKCLGGGMQGRLSPRTDEEKDRATKAGYRLDKVLKTDDLVSGGDVFFAATGITDGDLLKGVRYRGQRAATQSLVVRSRSGTIRTVESVHQRDKLKLYSSFEY